MVMNKKGLFYWFELILLILVLVIITLSFHSSNDGFLVNKDSVDMERLGFTTMQSLDNAGVFEAYIDSADFFSTNFTAVASHIRSSLPNTIITDIEYTDGINCADEFGNLTTTCGNYTRTKDTATAEYTYAKSNEPLTIKLYMRRILG